MEYIEIKIPSVLIYAVFGFGIFAGTGSFAHTLTGSDIIGYVSGVVCVILVILSMHFAGLTIK